MSCTQAQDGKVYRIVYTTPKDTHIYTVESTGVISVYIDKIVLINSIVGPIDAGTTPTNKDTVLASLPYE